jgi:hypothetical protein
MTFNTVYDRMMRSQIPPTGDSVKFIHSMYGVAFQERFLTDFFNLIDNVQPRTDYDTTFAVAHNYAKCVDLQSFMTGTDIQKRFWIRYALGTADEFFNIFMSLNESNQSISDVIEYVKYRDPDTIINLTKRIWNTGNPVAMHIIIHGLDYSLRTYGGIHEMNIVYAKLWLEYRDSAFITYIEDKFESFSVESLEGALFHDRPSLLWLQKNYPEILSIL